MLATDFNYGNKTINASGPIKPSGKDMPQDPRTRINTYSEKETIPNPFVGMIVTVLTDENNNNKMRDYKVKSLKANSAGIPNMVIDEMIPYVDYLGVSSGEGSSSGSGSIDTSNLASDLSLSGTSLQLKNSAGDLIGNSVNIPQKTSDLANDSDYATTSYVDDQIAKIEISGGSSELANLLIVI